MPYDYEGAKASGLTDEDIVAHLSTKQGYNLTGAQEAGLGMDEILPHLLEKENQPTQPVGPEPLIVPAPPPPEPSLLQKAGTFAKGIPGAILKHRLKPLAAALTTPIGGGGGVGPLHDYIVNNGLEERLAQGVPEDEAIKQTVRSNITDLSLTALDVSTVMAGGAITTLMRGAAAKIGLKGALGLISSGAIEAGGYGSTYEGIQSAIEGDSMSEIAGKMGKGFLFGLPFGAAVGAAGAGIEAIQATRATMRKGKLLTEQIGKDKIQEARNEAKRLQRMQEDIKVHREVAEKARLEQVRVAQTEASINQAIESLPMVADLDELAARNAIRDHIKSTPIASTPIKVGGAIISKQQAAVMSADELEAAAKTAMSGEVDDAVAVFGPEKAKQYERAQRIVNSQTASMNKEKYEAANKLIEDMESGLTPEQEQRLFGIDEPGMNAEDLKSVARVAREYAPENLTDREVSDLMNVVGRELLTGHPYENVESAIRLQNSMQELARRGMGMEAIQEAVTKRAIGEGVEPEDAKFLLQNTLEKLKQNQAPKLPMPGQTLSPEELNRATSQALLRYTRAAQDAAAEKIRESIKPIDYKGDPKPAFLLSGTPIDEELTSRFQQTAMSTRGAGVPELPIVERAPSVKYFGTPELRPYVRAQSKEPLTVRENIQKAWNRYVKGAYTAEPGAPKSVKDAFLTARYSVDTAGDRATQTVGSRIVSLLQGKRREVGEKSAWLSDYMAGLARVTRMKELGQAGPGFTSQAQWEREVEMLAEPVRNHPDIFQATRATRQLLDEMHDTMVDYGIIDPERYRGEYIPFIRIHELAGELAKISENTAVGKRLSATLKAQEAGQITKTNVISLVRDSLEILYKKAAEQDLVQTLINDPTVNFTHLFEEGQPLPKGYARWFVQPGKAGWQGTDALSEAFYGAAHGASKELNLKKHVPGNYVFDDKTVARLQQFYAHSGSETEKTIYKAANTFARFLTLYSPTNRALNFFSDHVMALQGLPGEASDVFGFIRAYPKAMKESYKGAFGKDSALYRRAVQEGIAGSTYIRSVGGEIHPAEIEAALAQGEQRLRNPLSQIGEFITRERQAAETTPRLAAALAAERKTGKASEFTRVGRAITLPYGPGDPALAREPIGRLLAPFWRWQGLAAERMFGLATTKGSLGRTWAALTLPAVSAATWNFQNDEFRDAEYSLPTYVRNHMHVILMDDDGKVKRDTNGQPRVWFLRFHIPEEILGFYGLGNMPGRAVDLASGYTSPGEAAKQTGSEFAGNVASLPAPITSTLQLLTGRSSLTGQELEPAERIESLTPGVYLAAKTAETAQNKGIGAAIKELPQRTIGIRSLGFGAGDRDARIRTLTRQIGETEAAMKSAGRIKNTAKLERLKKKRKTLVETLQRVSKARQKQADQ